MSEKKKHIAFSQEPKLENNSYRNRENKRFISKHSYEQHYGIK